MGRIIFILFNILILAAALIMGGFFVVVFACLFAGVSLFLYLYVKFTGRLPGNLHIHRFNQRTHRKENSGPHQSKIIDVEYEEVESKDLK